MATLAWPCSGFRENMPTASVGMAPDTLHLSLMPLNYARAAGASPQLAGESTKAKPKEKRREERRNGNCLFILHPSAFILQNSRRPVSPGWGTGYLPLGKTASGGGESAVSLSRPGPNSCSCAERLVPSDDAARMRGHTSHEGRQAGLGAPLDFVVRLVLADGLDEIVPFDLVGIRLPPRELPKQVGAVEVLPLVDAGTGRKVPEVEITAEPWCRGRSWRTPRGSRPCQRP